MPSAEYKQHVATVYARKAIESGGGESERLKTVFVIVTRARKALVRSIVDSDPRARTTSTITFLRGSS